MTYSFLALGDSYTIGEGVPLHESFPYQTVQRLRDPVMSGGSEALFSAPEIVARTGWTTGELLAHIKGTRFLPAYDLVSLLIGVNNEYRGRALPEYESEFEELLRRAIALAGGRTEHVFVLSIPDWSVTPFAHSSLPDAAGRDKARIAGEIDQFNAAAKRLAEAHAIPFIDITTHTREPGAKFMSDGLHPAAEEYRYWAERLAAAIAGTSPLRNA